LWYEVGKNVLTDEYWWGVFPKKEGNFYSHLACCFDNFSGDKKKGAFLAHPLS